jgi:hypothetical protein
MNGGGSSSPMCSLPPKEIPSKAEEPPLQSTRLYRIYFFQSGFRDISFSGE